MLDLRLENIKDPLVRDVIENILLEFRAQSILNFFWKSYELTVTAGGTYTMPHGLNFTPKDWLKTGILGSSGADFYIDLDACDDTNYSIVISGACTARFLLGNLDTNSPF